MKTHQKLSVVILFAAALPLVSYASSEIPVPGSCTQSSLGVSTCECTLQSSADPASTIHGTVPCDSLLYFDMANGHDNSACFEQQAKCEFHNLYFAGGTCTEQVIFDGVKVPTAQDACASVLQCLNNEMCEGFYCSGTTIRSGWSLQSATPTSGH